MKNLDGRHKLAILGAVICWALSVWFSYLGFRIDSDKIAFVGWILAFVVTIVELVFNSQTGKLSLTLIVTGILCYAYGIWTNVTGFWSLQHPGVEFIIFSQRSIMPAFVGIIMEVLPEPLLMWGLMSNMDGDFLGNMIGLWNGKLSYAQPANNPQTHNNQSTVKSVSQKYTPTHKPNFNPAPKPSYPTQHKVTMHRDDDDDMMSRAAQLSTGVVHFKYYVRGYLIALPVSVATAMYNFRGGLGYLVGYSLGRFCDPDWDLITANNSESRLIRELPILGNLMFGIASVYGSFFYRRHRSWITHWPVISTLIRLIFIFFIPFVVGDGYGINFIGGGWVWFWFGMWMGLSQADAIHLYKDIFPSEE